MTDSEMWQYHLVWTPGEAFSTFLIAAARRNGQRYSWDTWTARPMAGMPTRAEVLNRLWEGTVESLERHSHLG